MLHIFLSSGFDVSSQLPVVSIRNLINNWVGSSLINLFVISEWLLGEGHVKNDSYTRLKAWGGSPPSSARPSCSSCSPYRLFEKKNDIFAILNLSIQIVFMSFYFFLKPFYLLFKDFIYFWREGKGRRKRGKETLM